MPVFHVVGAQVGEADLAARRQVAEELLELRTVARTVKQLYGPTRVIVHIVHDVMLQLWAPRGIHHDRHVRAHGLGGLWQHERLEKVDVFVAQQRLTHERAVAFEARVRLIMRTAFDDHGQRLNLAVARVVLEILGVHR